MMAEISNSARLPFPKAVGHPGRAARHHFRTVLILASGSSQGERRSPCQFDGKLGRVLAGVSCLNSSFHVLSANFLYRDNKTSALSAKPLMVVVTFDGVCCPSLAPILT